MTQEDIKYAIENTSATIWGDGLGYVVGLATDEMELAHNLIDYVNSMIKQSMTATPSERRDFANSIRELMTRLIAILNKYGLISGNSYSRFIKAVNKVLAILEENEAGDITETPAQ